MDPANNKVHLRGHLPAPPHQLGLQRRRTGQRDLEVYRRRPHLDQAHQRHPRRRPWAASGSTSTGRTRTSSTRAIEHPHRGRRSIAPTTRVELDEDHRLQSAPDVLQPGPHRPRTTTTASTSWASSCTCPTTAGRTFVAQRRAALGSPRPLDRPGELRTTCITGCDGGVNVTWDRGQELGLHRQHRHRAVLPRRLRHGHAVPRLRRPAGQRIVGRAQCRARRHRHRELRLADIGERRRLRHAWPIRPTRARSTPSRRAAT